MIMTTAQKLEFKTEVQELLHLMIHSLYSNKEIFLRELISNASDAIDKLRFLALTDKNLAPFAKDFQIFLSFDEKKKTLTIRDNGIGMTKAEVIENIGTIAKSGTKQFIEQIKKAQDQTQLIGQFGVGFYSAFMVADKVTLVTKKAGTTAAIQWESEGSGYTIEETSKESHGTEITLHLKKENEDLASEWRLKEIVKKYSDFIEHPVQMNVEIDEYPQKEGKPDYEAKPTKKIELQTLNSRKAIWLKDKKEITAEEYKEFYKHVSHDWNDPLETIHFSAEGKLEFKALLFLPGKAPHDLFWPEAKRGIQLFVKKVFIMDDCKKLIPDYLRFVKGVVDSSDLPLNVSREILQEDVILEKIKGNLTKKILGTLKTLKEKDFPKYLNFWKEFGKVFKEGSHSDFENRNDLQDLYLFESTQTKAGEFTSLKDYVSRMPKDQKEIYYMSGESRKLLENSPHLEAFKKKNYEVFFLTDPIDEWVTQSLNEYDKKPLKSANKGQVDLQTDAEKKDSEKIKEEQTKKLGSLLEFIKAQFPEKIKEVRLSNRLTDSPVCLVVEEHEMGSHMEKLFKQMGQEAPKTLRIMELNGSHPIVSKMQGLYEQNKQNPKLKDYATLLLDQALLAEGSPIEDIAGFTKRLNELLIKDLG